MALEECRLTLEDIPVEKDRLHLLGDVTFEAELLLKAKYIETLSGGLQNFKEFLTRRNRGTYLLTGNTENGRVSLLVENGKVSSALFVDSYTGERISGEKSLEILLGALYQHNIVFRVFEVKENKETVQVQSEIIEQPAPPEKPVEKSKPAVPVEKLAIDFDKLQQFKKEFRQIASETAEAYGCRIVDLVYELVGNDLTILITLRKKGIFGKCLEKEFAETIENDIPLLRDNFDLKLNIHLETRLAE